MQVIAGVGFVMAAGDLGMAAGDGFSFKQLGEHGITHHFWSRKESSSLFVIRFCYRIHRLLGKFAH